MNIFLPARDHIASLFSSCYNALNSFNNLQKIEEHKHTALRVLSIIGIVFSTGVGFYSFQFIATPLSLPLVVFTIFAFMTSALLFFQLVKNFR